MSPFWIDRSKDMDYDAIVFIIMKRCMEFRKQMNALYKKRWGDTL